MNIIYFNLVLPQIAPFDFGDETTNTGDTVVVNCIVSKGDLPIEIRWVIHSSPVVSGENGITILKTNQRTSTMSINSVEGMHRGTFKCIAKNKAGATEYTADLHVNGLSMKIDVFLF